MLVEGSLPGIFGIHGSVQIRRQFQNFRRFRSTALLFIGCDQKRGGCGSGLDLLGVLVAVVIGTSCGLVGATSFGLEKGSDHRGSCGVRGMGGIQSRRMAPR